MNRPTGLLTMSHKELERTKVLEQVLSGRMSRREAGEQLSLTVRHISRLLNNYKQLGCEGLLSKRRGKVSNRSFEPVIKETIMNALKATYADFGPTFAAEKLFEREGLKVNKETVRLWMIEAGLRSSKPRKTKRVYQQRQRRHRFGELVQIDGSFHAWFEARGEPCCLLVFIDDATSQLVALHFLARETTAGYFQAARGYFNRYGRPLAFYSDKHSIFRINWPEADKTSGKTQFGRAMEELDIELICAHSPQAKGRVERANSTLQDRLIKELRLAGISTIEQANAFSASFIKNHNNKFAKPAALDDDAHRKLLPNSDILDLIFSHQEHRILSKNLELSYRNKIYQIKSPTQSYAMRKASVLVCEQPCGIISILYKKYKLPFEVFDKNNPPTAIIEAKEINNTLNIITKKSKPSSDHPWKKYAKIATAVKQEKASALNANLSFT